MRNGMVKVYADERQSALADLLSQSSKSLIADVPVQFEFTGDKCIVTYSKVCMVDADKARQYLGGIQ